MLIAGDIGGTKTLLAVFDPQAGPRAPRVQREYRSADWPSLDAMALDFLAGAGLAVTAACFDVAGPVIDGHAKLTNLPWMVDAASLRQSLGLHDVFLLNDLEAIAHAVPRLVHGEYVTINPGTPQPRAPIAVVAPGTGLGEAFLLWAGTGYRAYASEGGHAGFAPSTAREAVMWTYLHARFGHVSAERVCSGQGVANIYDFLCSADPANERPDFAATLQGLTDRTPAIVQAGLADPVRNSLASEAIDLFVAGLAAESANMVLKVLGTGGLYLAGGMPARVLPRLTDGRFMSVFANKGRFTGMLQQVPVHVVTTGAALLGAAIYGLDALAAPGTTDRTRS